MPGLECLSDPQILPILFALDPDSLLSCGRANRRLNRLVCDKQVWKNLLKGIEYFYRKDEEEDKDDDDKRMDELVKFVVDFGSSNMKAELLKEVASRFIIYYSWSIGYSSSKKASPVASRS